MIMTQPEALKILEAMPKQEFDTFFETLPARVKLAIQGGLSNWRDVLPLWYIRHGQPEEPQGEIDPDDIPF